MVVMMGDNGDVCGPDGCPLERGPDDGVMAVRVVPRALMARTLVQTWRHYLTATRNSRIVWYLA